MRRSIVIALSLLVCLAPAAPAGASIRKPGWVAPVTITEYYPVPEEWFVGAKVDAPGLSGQHRVDWLYSARGVSMEGDGVDLDGNQVHIDQLGNGGWVDAKGRSTGSDGAGHWSSGGPFWRAGAYWRSADGFVTFPLDAGGWFKGEGRKYVNPPGATFAPGPSRPLTPYKSIAVDPSLISLGSKVYISQYKDHGGWFTAADVGGAIQGRHVDVYRTPPAGIDDQGQSFSHARIYVVPPGRKPPKGAPPGADRGPTPAPTPTGPAPGPSGSTGQDGGASPSGGTSGG